MVILVSVIQEVVPKNPKMLVPQNWLNIEKGFSLVWLRSLKGSLQRGKRRRKVSAACRPHSAWKNVIMSRADNENYRPFN